MTVKLKFNGKERITGADTGEVVNKMMRDIEFPSKENWAQQTSGDDMRRVRDRRTLPMRMFFLILAFTLLGCSQHRIPLDPDFAKSRLPFLIEKRTTKEELVTRLGHPVNEYENGRIVTYIMREDLELRFQVADAGPSRTLTSEVYNLVLVFGPTAILERYSLIRVR